MTREHKKPATALQPKKRRTSPRKGWAFNFGAWIPAAISGIPNIIREIADSVVKFFLIPESKEEARLKNAEKIWELAQKIARESGRPVEEVLKHLNNQTSGVRSPAGELPPADR